MSTAPRSTDMLNALVDVATGAITADIQSECQRTTAPGEPGGRLWWDTRPMVDEREHAPEVVAMATRALALGAEMGIIHRHPIHHHLVRIL
ncbi:MAG: hypothetical protein IPM06_20380 [Rhizobiales bacterium]|nr:hypothetical protein [Hyphomicrobiales bacterium]